MPDAVFFRDGDRFVPTELARGPWTPQAQHGGAPAGLLARAVERFEGGETMFVARLTIELLRPVPISPLSIDARFARPGRKVQLVVASLSSGDTEVARVTALRIRRVEMPLPADLPRAAPPPGPHSGTASLPPWAAAVGYPAFHSRAVEHRFVSGSFERPGPATDWIRLRVPLVDGEPTSPLCRVAAASDFGNGVSWVLDRADGYSFINPDLTVYLHRLPAGEWVCLEAVTRVEAEGVGLAESTLYDEHGPIGRAVQSLIVEHAPH
ncbi:MAG TPA: thioesterase family protein [Candidatus Acidoferrales bacterium]|nr:thioesterase family protein [Candidatus Acidoferrales bacterium]